MIKFTLLHFAVITFHGSVISLCESVITFRVGRFYYILRKSYYISRIYYILRKWYYISRRLLHLASVLHLAAQQTRHRKGPPAIPLEVVPRYCQRTVSRGSQ